MGGALANAAKSLARKALSSIKSALGIASPSKVMRDEVGKWIPSGVAVGIEANTKPITEAMHNLSDMTTGTLQTDLQVVRTVRSGTETGIAAGAGEAFGQVPTMETILELVSNIEENTTMLMNANNKALRELLDAVLGIRIGDEQIARAVSRYNRKMNVLQGGF